MKWNLARIDVLIEDVKANMLRVRKFWLERGVDISAGKKKNNK